MQLDRGRCVDVDDADEADPAAAAVPLHPAELEAKAVKDIEKRCWKGLHATLLEDSDREDLAAWFLSQSAPGTGSIFTKSTADVCFRLSPDDFVAWLRARLLGAPFDDLPHGTRCPYCPDVRLDRSLLHHHNCWKNQGLRDFRHDCGYPPTNVPTKDDGRVLKSSAISLVRTEERRVHRHADKRAQSPVPLSYP